MSETKSIQVLLEERTRQWAKKPDTHTATKFADVLMFIVEGDQLGIETHYVNEVRTLTDLTPVPGTPQWLRGMSNVRGRVVAVIDLKLLTGGSRTHLSDRNFIIILQHEGMELGVIADRVLGAEELTEQQLQTNTTKTKIMESQHLLAITKTQAIILNGKMLLQDKRFNLGS